MIKIQETFYNLRAKNFEDMVNKITPYLLTKKYITKDFSQSIIKREMKYPTGLAFNNVQIAIPHTESEFVKKSAIIVVKLLNPIKIIHMATKDRTLKIFLFFFLLIDKSEKHMDLLTQLMDTFNKPKFALKVKSIQKEEDVKNILVT